MDQVYLTSWCSNCILTDKGRVRKGQNIVIPILAMNRARDIWGDDSMEFRYVFYSLESGRRRFQCPQAGTLGIYPGSSVFHPGCMGQHPDLHRWTTILYWISLFTCRVSSPPSSFCIVSGYSLLTQDESHFVHSYPRIRV